MASLYARYLNLMLGMSGAEPYAAPLATRMQVLNVRSGRPFAELTG